MSMRIKAREKNLLLTCRSANKVEQVKTIKDGLKDTPKRKNYSKYQIEETERLDDNSRKRRKTIRKSHSEKEMKIPMKGSVMVKLEPVSINSEEKYRNLKKQTQNQSTNYIADNYQKSSRPYKDNETAVLSKGFNQSSDGPDRKGDTGKKIIFVSLNLVDKPDKYDKKIKPGNHTKLRRLWKNLQSLSNYHKKQKIGRLRKYCCRKPNSNNRKNHEKNKSYRNYLEHEKMLTPRNKTKETMQTRLRETRNKKIENIFESGSHTSKAEFNEASNYVIDERDRDLLDFLHQKGSHFTDNLTPENDVSKIDEKYLKYILLITNREGVNALKNNENQENINTSEDRDEEIVSKDKKSLNVLKDKTSQNQLKSKRNPSNTLEDNNQSKDHLMENKKNLIDHESESGPTRESTISDQRTKPRKKFIVLKLKSPKESDQNEKSRIDNKKESGSGNTKEDKQNLRKPNSKNPTPKTIVTTKPPQGQVSKVEFVEIWRRNSRKESQDSLASHSSSEPPDNQEKSDEDSSDCEYLGIRSYQTLKNIVEEEVLKIFKSYKQKDAENERKKIEPKTTENTKAPAPLDGKSGTNKPQLENKTQPVDEQLTLIKDDISDVKSDRVSETKITLPPQQEKLPPQNQNTKKPDNEYENLKVITRNSSVELNKKLKILSEQENTDFRIPSEILKNWTIMHRLEKAFLALGTPNFHGKSLPPAKTKAVGGKATNTHNEKVGTAKTKPKPVGPSAGDESKTSKPCKPNVNSSQSKTSQKKLDTKHSTKSKLIETKYSETEQKVKNSKTEKETVKESKKKDINTTPDLAHPRKGTQPFSSKIPTEISNGKKPDGISLSTDHKTKIKRRFRPDTLSRVPRKILENNDTEKKEKTEKPIQTQEVSTKPTAIPAKSEPTRKDDRDNGDANLDSKGEFSTDSDKSSVLECNQVNKIEHSLAEEATDFDFRIEKLLDLKSSENLLLESQDQNKIKDGNLERKKTFAVFPMAETTDLKPKKSQTCQKLEVFCKTDDIKCSSSTIHQKFNTDYWDTIEENDEKSICEQHSGSQTVDTDQKYSSKTELLRVNNCSSKNNGYIYNKSIIYSDEDVTPTKQPELFQDPSDKEKLPVEDIPQKLLFSRKEINLNDRVVKERSILSLIQNLKKTQRKPSSETINRIPSTEAYKKPHDGTTPDVFLQRIFHTKGSQTNYSNMSAISTSTYDIVPESSAGCGYSGHQTPKQIIVSSKQSPIPPAETISTTTYRTVRLSRDLPSSMMRTAKIQPNWERDIRQYRAIVQDIIDQYKRTKGFLKQNEELLNPLTGIKFIDFQGDTPPSSNLGFLDINEYRRKIISEYRDLSIFEYKSQIQETSISEEKKPERGLAVVKEVIPEMDYDIKDFQPNVKKVLNSQIYMDQNHFYKLKCLRVKPADQNPSLQDVMLGTSKLESQQIQLNEQLKSARFPKSNISLPNSKVYSVLFHTPNHSKVEVDNDFTFDDFMSLSEFEETESDFTDYH